MPQKKHKPEEIVAKLRQVDVLVSQGQSVAEAVRSIGVTQFTYYRWRKEFGGLKTDQVKRLFGIDHARDAVARWTHSYHTERPHAALGYQAPVVFAAQLTAMGDQLGAHAPLRRSSIAPSAQPSKIQQRTLVSAGRASGSQHDLQALHRVRSRLFSRRTATINQIRAFLIEQGITIRKGLRAVQN